MRKMKYWLGAILVCLALAVVLPAQANAVEVVDSGTCGDNLTWVLTDDGTLTISGDGEMDDFVLGKTPWYDNRDAITEVVFTGIVLSIGDSAFSGCEYLASITLPRMVTSIGMYAFELCRCLESITIPDGVQRIEEGTFYGSGLKSITIPAGMQSIGYEAFASCYDLTTVRFLGTEEAWNSIDKSEGNGIPEDVEFIFSAASGICGSDLIWMLTYDGTLIISGVGEMYGYRFDSAPWYENRELISRVVVESGVQSIGMYAFANCARLTEVEIPDSCTSIGAYAFAHCASLSELEIPDSVQCIGAGVFENCCALKSITVDAESTAFCSVDGVLFNREKTTLICYPGGKTETAYVIPASVTGIEERAFCNARLTEVEIPDGVQSIGDYAFTLCANLATVFFKGDEQTWNSIDIGEGNDELLFATIKFERFSGTCGENLTWVLHGDGLLAISGEGEMTSAPWTYHNANISSVVIGDSVTSITGYAFSDCTALTSVVIGDSVQSIGIYAFRNCTALTSVVIGDSVQTIGDEAFKDCRSLTSIVIPDSVTSIGGGAFLGCRGATSVVIGDSVTNIGRSAFSYCTALTSVEIPASVQSIGEMAFIYCIALTDVTVSENNAHYSSKDGVLFNKEQTELIRYPEGKTDTEYQIPDSVQSIGGYAFHYCLALTSIVIPDSVQSIGDKAFINCTALTSVVIGDSVQSISASAFSGCRALTSITVSEDNAHYSNKDGVLFNKEQTELILYPAKKTDTEYQIPDSVTSVCNGAFYACSVLTSIVIPDSVTSIGDEAFYSCSVLSSVVIGDSVTSIGDEAFFYCAALTSIVIPNSVTSIGGRAFSCCAALTSIVIPNSVTSIGDGTFEYCTALTSVEIPSSVTSIGNGAFSYCNVLKTVYYRGTAGQWNAITIEDGNSPLLNAEIIVDSGVYGLVITADAAGIPTLIWEEDWSVEGYEIWRMAENGAYELIATVDGTTFTDETAVPGTMYFYAVRSVYEDGYSDFSDIVVWFRMCRGPLGKIPD